MSVWLLVLFVIGHEPELVSIHDSGAKCRAQAIARNAPRHSTDFALPDPSKRYACFVLDSAT